MRKLFSSKPNEYFVKRTREFENVRAFDSSPVVRSVIRSSVTFRVLGFTFFFTLVFVHTVYSQVVSRLVFLSSFRFEFSVSFENLVSSADRSVQFCFSGIQCRSTYAVILQLSPPSSPYRMLFSRRLSVYWPCAFV